jgi:CheY-like chemotaxis protein
MAKKQILIVDDEPKVGFFLGRSLEVSNADCAVTTATSGEEALEILKQTPMDLLITDLRMPGISGLELIRWVKQYSPDTRTVLITAYGSGKIEAEAHRLQIYHYLTKPFNVKEFTQVVDGALDQLALTSPGLTVFSDEVFERLSERLESLRYDVGASCILLADMQGQRLVEVGPTDGIDITMLLTLLAGGFATSAELARKFNEGEAVNLNFQEGPRYDIYSANVGDNLILVLLYDRRAQKSRVGMVWLYTRRVVDDLLDILSSVEGDDMEHVLEDDFGSSLMAELDMAFGGGDSVLSAPPSDTSSTADASSTAPSSPTHSPKRTASPSSTTGSKAAAASPSDKASAAPDEEQELLSLEDAIDKGLLPSNFGHQS